MNLYSCVAGHRNAGNESRKRERREKELFFHTQVSIIVELFFVLVGWDVAETRIWKRYGRQK